MKFVQQKHFKKEYKWLKGMEVKDSDSRRLNKTAGYLNWNHLLINQMWSVLLLLLKKGTVSDLIIKHCYRNVAQGGHRFTLNEIQGAGNKVISNCVECRGFRGGVREQKMANLLAFRSKEAAEFIHCGVNMFFFFKWNKKGAIWCYAYMHGQQDSTDWSHLFLGHKFLYFSFSENWRKHIWRWKTKRFNFSCKNKVLTGLDGTIALFWQVIWLRFGSDRFAQQDSFWNHF